MEPASHTKPLTETDSTEYIHGGQHNNKNNICTLGGWVGGDHFITLCQQQMEQLEIDSFHTPRINQAVGVLTVDP